MFKVGQKVRTKQWLDMPEDVLAVWGSGSRLAGKVGVVESINNSFNTKGYDVILGKDKYATFCLPQEIEPLIRVGEQLMLFEI